MLLIIDNKKFGSWKLQNSSRWSTIWFQNAKNLEIGTKKIITDEARYLCGSLIKPDVDKLEKSKSRGKDKRNNILIILNNIETSAFDGAYLHYSDKPSGLESEESIEKRLQLRKQRFNEVTKEGKKISS